MAVGPVVLRDLSACWHDGGAHGTGRVRAMRMLVAREDPGPGDAASRPRLPQSFCGCFMAAHYYGWEFPRQ